MNVKVKFSSLPERPFARIDLKNSVATFLDDYCARFHRYPEDHPLRRFDDGERATAEAMAPAEISGKGKVLFADPHLAILYFVQMKESIKAPHIEAVFIDLTGLTMTTDVVFEMAYILYKDRKSGDPICVLENPDQSVLLALHLSLLLFESVAMVLRKEFAPRALTYVGYLPTRHMKVLNSVQNPSTTTINGNLPTCRVKVLNSMENPDTTTIKQMVSFIRQFHHIRISAREARNILHAFEEAGLVSIQRDEANKTELYHRIHPVLWEHPDADEEELGHEIFQLPMKFDKPHYP